MGALKAWMVCSFFLLRLNWKYQTYSKVFEPQNQYLMEFDCPTWHFYNQESGEWTCECYQFNDEDDIIECRDNGITMLQYMENV